MKHPRVSLREIALAVIAPEQNECQQEPVRNEHIPAQPAFPPCRQRKSQPCCSGGPPLRGGARKTAPRAQQAQRPGPIPWQIKCRCAVQGKDARCCKPVPMLFQRRFGSPQKPRFANSPASVVAIEGFGLRNNSHVVPSCSANPEPPPALRPPGPPGK